MTWTSRMGGGQRVLSRTLSSTSKLRLPAFGAFTSVFLTPLQVRGGESRVEYHWVRFRPQLYSAY
jgi:hypothetical protein